MNTVLWRLIFTYFVSQCLANNISLQKQKRTLNERKDCLRKNRFRILNRIIELLDARDLFWYEFQCAASFDDIVATYFCFQILENPCKCLRSV